MYERFVFIVFIHEYCNVIMMACHSIVKTGRNRFRCYHYKCFVILLPIVLCSVIFWFMENISLEKTMKAWNDAQNKLRSICADTPSEERNEAIAFCRSLHVPMKKHASETDYADFLAEYAQVLMFDEMLVQEEIDVQEELIKIRQRQAEENRAKYFPRYTNGLFYLGYAHMRAGNPREAMVYMEQAVENERVISREMPEARTNGLAVATYMLAHTYNTFARKILAEDTYKEALIEYKALADKTPDNKKIYEVMADITVEFAEYYWSVPHINKALDRYWQAESIYKELLPDESAMAKLRGLYELMIKRYRSMGNDEQCDRLSNMLQACTHTQ